MNMTFDDYKELVSTLRLATVDISKVVDKRNDEIKQLKEKMKFYLEPFELRPTYQELEKKLSNIDRIVNTRYTYTNYNSWYQTLQNTLSNKSSLEDKQ